jgi:hypothetical protein
MCKGTRIDGTQCRMVPRTHDGLCVLCASMISANRERPRQSRRSKSVRARRPSKPAS